MNVYEKEEKSEEINKTIRFIRNNLINDNLSVMTKEKYQSFLKKVIIPLLVDFTKHLNE